MLKAIAPIVNTYKVGVVNQKQTLNAVVMSDNGGVWASVSVDTRPSRRLRVTSARALNDAPRGLEHARDYNLNFISLGTHTYLAN